MTDDGQMNGSDLCQSQESEVVISEDYPMIQASSEGSFCNRVAKLVEKLRQMEFISELDFFKIPLQLNFQGNKIHKTEFGGLLYIGICFACIFLTVILKFPNGLALKSVITQYQVIKDIPVRQTVFDYSDFFCEVVLHNIHTNEVAPLDVSAFIIEHVFVYQNINGVGTKLEVQRDCRQGFFCFKMSKANAGTTIYGKFGSADYGSISVEIVSCSYDDDVSPTLGACWEVWENYTPVFRVTNFMEQTGKIVPTPVNIPLLMGTFQIVNVVAKQFTTNQNILGHVANAASYQLNYYEVLPVSYMMGGGLPNVFFSNRTTMDCNSNECTSIQIVYNGNLHIVTQNFDDVTAPLLFFMSISQTIFLLAYLLFLRNYGNNALSLKIADTLVFIYSPTGAHHNFKSGMATVVACLLHNHPLVGWLNAFLYRFYQTEVKRWMPIKVQMTMDMIDYGQRCMGEKEFFQRINSIYEQQNLQPAKIMVDIPEEEEEPEQVEKDEQTETEEGPIYFQDQIETEAFRRMCAEHQFYSIKRKAHLCCLLKMPGKNYKLVLLAQDIFSRYKTQVKRERQVKEAEFPVMYMQEELTVNHLRKQSENFD